MYGGVLLMAAVAYWLLQHALIAAEGAQSALRRAIGADWKGRLSPLLYLVGIALSGWLAWVAQLIYVLAALIWLVPDRRIEDTLEREGDDPPA